VRGVVVADDRLPDGICARVVATADRAELTFHAVVPNGFATVILERQPDGHMRLQCANGSDARTTTPCPNVAPTTYELRQDLFSFSISAATTPGALFRCTGGPAAIEPTASPRDGVRQAERL
jgi:hypothetical protein